MNKSLFDKFNDWLTRLPRKWYWALVIVSGLFAYFLGDILRWIF